VTLRLLDPVMSHDGIRQITKMDLKGSDKRFSAALPGHKRQVWIVEGGIDALAPYRTGITIFILIARGLPLSSAAGQECADFWICRTSKRCCGRPKT
jgi:hypothetical protein